MTNSKFWYCCTHGTPDNCRWTKHPEFAWYYSTYVSAQNFHISSSCGRSIVVGNFTFFSPPARTFPRRRRRRAWIPPRNKQKIPLYLKKKLSKKATFRNRETYLLQNTAKYCLSETRAAAGHSFWQKKRQCQVEIRCKNNNDKNDSSSFTDLGDPPVVVEVALRQERLAAGLDLGAVSRTTL